MKKFLFLATSSLLLMSGAQAAVILMDQVGPNSATLTTQGFASQLFEAGQAGFNIASIDDFTVTGGAVRLNLFEGVAGRWNGPTDYSGVQSWNVEIYNSTASAASSLTGNVGSAVFAPGSVALTTFGGGGFNTTLVSIDLSGSNIVLNPGTYWIGLLGRVDFSPNGQIGIFASSFAGFPLGANALQANPGGGFGFPGGIQTIGTDLAYRLTAVDEAAAVPEPGTWATAGLALLGLGGALRKRR